MIESNQRLLKRIEELENVTLSSPAETCNRSNERNAHCLQEFVFIRERFDHYPNKAEHYEER